jgi:hypothetical protein
MSHLLFHEAKLLKTALYLLFFIGILAVQPVLANELKLSPSVTLKEEYNDNIFLDVTNRKSDFISTLTPCIELSDRSERLDANLLLRLNGILYGRTSELNAVDQDYRGRLRYILSPRTSLSLQAGYTLDSQPDRETATTGLVIGPVKRHRQQYSFSGEPALTEKTSAALAYSYEQDDYDNNRFSNLKYHDASLIFTHDLDWLMRATKGSVNFDYAHYKSSVTLIDSLTSDSTVDNFSATIGMSRAFSEVWSVQANAGGRYTISKFRSWEPVFVQILPPLPTFQEFLEPVNQKSHEWGWVGQLVLSYKGELTEGSLTFNTDVQPASGQTSGTTVRTGLVADMRRRFTYELSGAMSVGYYHNKSNPGATAGQAIDQDTILLTPGIRYEFNKDMYMEASYQFTKVFYNISHTEADRNSFFVRLYMEHPFFM